MKIRIGIDVGKQGALFVHNEDGTYLTYKMPLIAKEYDLAALSNILIEYCQVEGVMVVLEDLRAIFGSSAGATFSFGMGFGIIQALLVAYQIPYTLVYPKEWQKMCFQGIPEIRKPQSEKQKIANRKGSIDTKAMALLAAKRLYPSYPINFGGRATKAHDGLIDAILLCHYAKQKFN